MHPYRSHTCGQLCANDVGITARLAGWVHSKRNHGNLLFIDLRDHYGITQIVADSQNPIFSVLERIRVESVISVTGHVLYRTRETVNSKLNTGAVELKAEEVDVLAQADTLPFPIHCDSNCSEEMRLRYRFLDLRRENVHRNMILRSKIIASLRRRMIEQGFLECQTPILTTSTPEGARDFLVPSRVHPGKFYALPQAPQQFKQLLMIANFDRYFQIAPCFRDEDSRSDRSPGEFYQLDFEMSFVTQEDIFTTIEPVLHGIFEEFSDGRTVSAPPFLRIPFEEAILKYGTDKPDLRNPLLITDLTEIYRGSSFDIFARAIEEGAVVRAIMVSSIAGKPRSWFDRIHMWACNNGATGLGYLKFNGQVKGSLAKKVDSSLLERICELTGTKDGDAIFFICDKPDRAANLAGQVRTYLCNDLDLLEKNALRFCWTIDFPFYKKDPSSGCIQFSHNPFSMPQGGLEALNHKDPLTIKAFQYDIICNGIELSSGAIRNHRLEIMYKAFEIAGYSKSYVDGHFSSIVNAFRFGVPPHGGAAPGIDRIIMLLTGEPNLRETVLFPMNQQAQDLMMQAPKEVLPEQLRELHIRLDNLA